MISCRIVCLLAVAVITAQNANAADKACNRKVVDKCNEKLFMLGDDTFVFPQNLDQMNRRCKDLKELEKCVKDYSSKCLTRDAKQAVAVLSYGVTKTNKGYCVSGKRKNLFIETGKCLQKHKKKLDPLMWQMSAMFGAISKMPNTRGIDRSKIPLSCCYYYDFKQKSQEIVNSVCSHKIQSEYEAILNGYANEVLNLFCGEYTEESDKCSGLIRKHPLEAKPIPGKSPKVFVLPMVDIFDSLPR